MAVLQVRGGVEAGFWVVCWEARGGASPPPMSSAAQSALSHDRSLEGERTCRRWGGASVTIKEVGAVVGEAVVGEER